MGRQCFDVKMCENPGEVAKEEEGMRNIMDQAANCNEESEESLAPTVPEETRAQNRKRKVDPVKGKSLKRKRLDSSKEQNDESEGRFTMTMSSEYLKYPLSPKEIAEMLIKFSEQYDIVASA